MTALDQEQDVVDLAKRLGLNGTPVEAIINFCQSQIDGWVSEAGGVASIGELESLVADRLNLVFEEINDDHGCGICLTQLKKSAIGLWALPGCKEENIMRFKTGLCQCIWA